MALASPGVFLTASTPKKARHHHRKMGRIELATFKENSVRLHFFDRSIQMSPDVIVGKHPLAHLLCIPKATDSEVCREGFCGQVCKRRLLLEFVLGELIANIEQELVRSAEAGPVRW